MKLGSGLLRTGSDWMHRGAGRSPQFIPSGRMSVDHLIAQTDLCVGRQSVKIKGSVSLDYFGQTANRLGLRNDIAMGIIVETICGVR